MISPKFPKIPTSFGKNSPTFREERILFEIPAGRGLPGGRGGRGGRPVQNDLPNNSQKSLVLVKKTQHAREQLNNKSDARNNPDDREKPGKLQGKPGENQGTPGEYPGKTWGNPNLIWRFGTLSRDPINLNLAP